MIKPTIFRKYLLLLLNQERPKHFRLNITYFLLTSNILHAVTFSWHSEGRILFSAPPRAVCTALRLAYSASAKWIRPSGTALHMEWGELPYGPVSLARALSRSVSKNLQHLTSFVITSTYAPPLTGPLCMFSIKTVQ